jgi:hypothetical protein
MTNEFADSIIESRIQKIKDTLLVKAKEYVRNDDRMHNFNVGATIKDAPREQIIDDFMLKHYISYRDMLNDINNNNLPTAAYVDEKIGDIINYLILFEMSIKEKIYEQTKNQTLS